MSPTLPRIAVGLGVLAIVLACGGGEAPAPNPPAPVVPAAPVAPAAPAPPAAPAAAADLPGPESAIPYFAGPIPDSALHGRTLRELTLMRNTIYARAGNPFRKRWLHAHFSGMSWYAPLAQMDESKLTEIDRANAAKIAGYEAGLKRSDLYDARSEVVAELDEKLGKAPLPEQEALLIELMLLSRAVGASFPGDTEIVVPGWFAEKVDVTPLDDPSRLDRLLTVDELRDLSRRDLRLLRNTVYARRGRTFQSMMLADYFLRMEWYQPDVQYTDARLTDVDQRNIQLIRSVEDSIGGPLTDLQHQASDEWFGGA